MTIEEIKGSMYASVVQELVNVQNELVHVQNQRNEDLLTIENLNDEISRLRFENDKLNAELLTTGKRFMYGVPR
jgi:chromosome segregation ATPase